VEKSRGTSYLKSISQIFALAGGENTSLSVCCFLTFFAFTFNFSFLTQGLKMFDPNTFLDMTTTAANSTVYVPVPVGEYIAVVEKVTARTWVGKKDPTQSGIALDLLWEIDDQAVRDLLQRPKVQVKQGVMLEMDDHGRIASSPGKNVELGKLREAFGLNTPGEPFAPNMLAGRVAKVLVTHRIDNGTIFAEVKSVAKV
jgi:hypothetical protein